MRRKSERTSKKTKTSPEKKVEKPKRGRPSRRRKPSSSSENESPVESSPVVSTQVEPIEKKSPTKPVTVVQDDSPEEKQDQVWQVKTSEGSGDSGEIQKLKICLARPSSTPERVDKSPRSRRKHSRTTSSSDTAVEVTEDKNKRKHRSRRNARESKDDAEKNFDSQGDEPDKEMDEVHIIHVVEVQDDVSQSENNEDEIPMSTTSEDQKPHSDEVTKPPSPENVNDANDLVIVIKEDKATEDIADTTVDSSIADIQESQPEQNTSPEIENTNASQVETSEIEVTIIQEISSPIQKVEETIESSPRVIHETEESNSHKSDTTENNAQNETQSVSESQETNINEEHNSSDEKNNVTDVIEVTVPANLHKEVNEEMNEMVNNTSIIESSDNSPKQINIDHSIDSCKEKDVEDSHDIMKHKEYDCTDSSQLKEDSTQNGQAAPIIVSRKRRWGTRPSKMTTQKSLTISTEILKDIIPDVKPVEFEEVIEQKKHRKEIDAIERPILPRIIIDNTENVEQQKRSLQGIDIENVNIKDSYPLSNRKISIVKDNDSVLARPPSPPRHKSTNILYITNLVRPFTLPQLKNLLQRTGRIVEDGFWIDRIKSKCYVKYETEDQAVETRHALHGVTWPVSNPKTLQVDFSSQELFDKAKDNEENTETPASTIPGTVEDWLREQDLKKDRGDVEKPWERKNAVREWDVGKGDKDKERLRHDDRQSIDKRRHHSPEHSPEPARKFKKKEEEAPAKLLDDLFRKTKTTPCIYWLPLSAETIAVKEEQRRQHMAEHERRMQELRRVHRRH